MKKRPFLIVGLILILALGAYIATYQQTISWEVVDEKNKAKYIEVLEKQHIPYTEETDNLGRRWVTVTGYSDEEYKRITKEYTDWYYSNPNIHGDSKQ